MKLITANKLNRLWKNGVLPGLAKKIDVTRVLKTTEQVTANTNAENLPSAVVVGELYNKLASGQLEFCLQDGEGFWRAVGADTWRPFTSKLSTKSQILADKNGTVSDSIVCQHPGYAYIFVISMGGYGPCVVKHNSTVIFDGTVQSQCHALTPLKVNKGDNISWTITVVSGVYGSCVAVAFPA